MRAIIYSRTARAEQPIDGQRVTCEGYAAAHGYDIVEAYADPGVSGNSSPFERPGLGASLSNPDAWDTLVVNDLARVSRDRKNVVQLEGWLTEHGKSLETVGGLRFPHEGFGSVQWDLDKQITHATWRRRQEVAGLIREQNPSMSEDEVRRAVARDQDDEPGYSAPRPPRAALQRTLRRL